MGPSVCSAHMLTTEKDQEAIYFWGRYLSPQKSGTAKTTAQLATHKYLAIDWDSLINCHHHAYPVQQPTIFWLSQSNSTVKDIDRTAFQYFERSSLTKKIKGWHLCSLNVRESTKWNKEWSIWCVIYVYIYCVEMSPQDRSCFVDNHNQIQTICYRYIKRGWQYYGSARSYWTGKSVPWYWTDVGLDKNHIGRSNLDIPWSPLKRLKGPIQKQVLHPFI